MFIVINHTAAIDILIPHKVTPLPTKMGNATQQVGFKPNSPIRTAMNNCGSVFGFLLLSVHAVYHDIRSGKIKNIFAGFSRSSAQGKTPPAFTEQNENRIQTVL